MARNSNRIVDRAIEATWVVLGIAICVQSIGYGLWTPAGPGSGFIPFLTGVPIALLGLLLLAGHLRASSEHDSAPQFWASAVAMRRVILLVAILCLTAFFMPRAGFLLTATVATICMIRTIGPAAWTPVIATAVGSCMIIYVLFRLVLQVKLPTGFLGF